MVLKYKDIREKTYKEKLSPNELTFSSKDFFFTHIHNHRPLRCRPGLAKMLKCLLLLAQINC